MVLISLTLQSFAWADNPYWVFFQNGTNRSAVKLTARAETRLLERGSPEPAGNRAVSLEYLHEMKSAGFRIRHISRFLNAVSVEIKNDNQLITLNQFAFVKSVRPVAKRIPKNQDQTCSHLPILKATGLIYGPSLTQNQVLQIPALHDYGYDGSGILIGVFDTGFNTQHPAFDNLDIRAQYDFVDHETDPAGLGHAHGISVLSALGGYYPGEIIGPAYNASFLLARTEDFASETRAEEDNWVAALEWVDSLGVDIISSSLNYRDFDGSADDYPDSAIDGETAIITQAANIAAERGILIVNSAANEGPSAGSIWPPADSRHVLAVGAITSQGEIASFSSRGPTYDGRIKPDVVGMGVSVYLADGLNNFRHGRGTSFSTPVMAGLAALLLQAHPELAPDSVIILFQQNANRSSNPDNNYGYGVPDLRSYFVDLNRAGSKLCFVFPNPSSSNQVGMILPDGVADLVETATLYDLLGRQLASLAIESISLGSIQLGLPADQVLADQLYIIALKAGDEIYTGKFVYLK